MQLHIRHQTKYIYSAPSSYTIQQLHLTPRTELHQHIAQWSIVAAGHRHAYTDAYGNQSHTLTITEPHLEVNILASGIVNVRSPDAGRITDAEPWSPLIFTIPTQLTESSAEIQAFAKRSLPRKQSASSRELLYLAEQIRNAVAYQTGSTVVTTTANDALLIGRGVCQDHAHLFLACCHVMGVPSRYVSGYIDPESSDHAESHAWVDVWAQDHDYHGWISIDVTHVRLMTDSYCRLAIGRDYDTAAPVRGIRRGGGIETLTVSVQVTPQ